jgi:hypothetical protein
MFMITIHYPSTIHQKSVPEDFIHQVHDPHRSYFATSINLLSWRCCSTTLGGQNSSITMYWMWKNNLFLCYYKMVEENGTLEPTYDSTKSNGAVVTATSRWPGLVFLLIVVPFLSRLLPGYLLLNPLLLSCLLGRLLCGRLFFQLFNPRF